MKRQDQVAVFALSMTIWVAASLIGWMTDLEILAALAGMALGWIFARHHSYSDQEYLDDLAYGFAHVPVERRQSKAVVIAIFGIAFSAAVMVVPLFVAMDHLRFATPALGGIMLPNAVKFYLQTRRIGREGTSQ